MSYRNGASSPLVDLIQSYRREQIVRDQMRIDQMNRDREHAYRISRANQADRQWEKSFETGVQQWAYDRNVEAQERQRLADERAKKQAAQEHFTQDSLNLLGEREQELKGRLAAFAGGGQTGQVADFGLVDRGDSYTVEGVRTDGTRVGFNNVNPTEHDPSKALRIPKHMARQTLDHVDRLTAQAEQQNMPPEMANAYVRAGITQDPETNEARIATPEEQAVNLRNQGFIHTNDDIKEMTNEVSAKLEPKSLKNSRVQPKKNGDVAVSPKATPDDVVDFKRQVTEQGVNLKVKLPFSLGDSKDDAAQSPEAKRAKIEEELAQIQSEKRRHQAASKLYLANEIDEQAFLNYTATGDFTRSAAQVEKDALAMQVDAAQLKRIERQMRNGELEIRMKVKEHNAKMTGNKEGEASDSVKYADLLKSSDGRTILKTINSTVVGSIKQYNFRDDTKERLAAAVESELPALFTTSFFSQRDATSMGNLAALNIATGLKGRDMEAGRGNFPLVTYLVDVETQHKPLVASHITQTVQSAPENAYLSTPQGVVPLTAESYSYAFDQYLQHVVYPNTNGELTEADIAEEVAKFNARNGLSG
ncbi:hypothetical protein [Shewanella gaetbuli]|uniref:Uncharacterized protein n=1 Tax=Shewanella gaetbuli TaxID=220752 RepID=A0A9X2CLR7_9GAMM|nr:hypothetical protein [Shewanella gaetbuli]MCL1142984.1 hypothetical protein [Shewanella gaetbuli]